MAEKRKRTFKKPRPIRVEFREDQSLGEIGLIQEKLIGRVVVEWSKLENLLNDLLWAILGLDFEDGKIVTGRADVSNKVQLLRAIAPRYLTDSQLDHLLSALDIVDGLREDRNFIVHGTWHVILPEGQPWAASIRPSANPNEVITECFPPKRMRNIIQMIIKSKHTITSVLLNYEASQETPS